MLSSRGTVTKSLYLANKYMNPANFLCRRSSFISLWISSEATCLLLFISERRAAWDTVISSPNDQLSRQPDPFKFIYFLSLVASAYITHISMKKYPRCVFPSSYLFDSSEGHLSRFLCLLCSTAADLHAVKIWHCNKGRRAPWGDRQMVRKACSPPCVFPQYMN